MVHYIDIGSDPSHKSQSVLSAAQVCPARQGMVLVEAEPGGLLLTLPWDIRNPSGDTLIM